jgi:hypothetical protein
VSLRLTSRVPWSHSEDASHLLETALACGNGSFPPVAIVLHYLYTIAEKFPVQAYRVIAMRPRPQWGLGWRKGGYHQEKRISTAQIFIVILVIVLAAGISKSKKTGSVTGSPAGAAGASAVFRLTGYRLL